MAIPAVITYAYIRGKWYAFSDQASAQEGVTRYQGNIQSLRTSKPVGVLVDDRTFVRRPTSYWPDTLADAPGVTGDALINPPVNPIQGPTVVTPAVTPTVTSDVAPVVTPTVTATAAQSPSGGGNGGNGGKDYPNIDPSSRRESSEFIAGTNIRQSDVNRSLRSNSGDAVYWEERLRNSDKPNDVLFEMAFNMGTTFSNQPGSGQSLAARDTGQGNPFVGKVQSGMYGLRGDLAQKAGGKTWADLRTQTPQGGETDVYIQKNPDTGDIIGQTFGSGYLDRFKSSEWEPGDFGESAKGKSDAATWQRHHLKHAESGLGSYAGLSETEKADKITAITNRYNKMMGIT